MDVVMIEGAPVPPAIRPNQASLTDVEKNAFMNALTKLNESKGFGQLVAIHGQMQHLMHGSDFPAGTQRFLPWHRTYLKQFEMALQAIDPTVNLPYWDWAGDRKFPAWLTDVKPSVPMPDGSTINVIRDLGDENLLPALERVAEVLQTTPFTPFTCDNHPSGRGLESIHNTVHDWFTGLSSMREFETAPADPIFWMHHANVDRLWCIWYSAHCGEHGFPVNAAFPTFTNPAQDGPEPMWMDPWEVPNDTRFPNALWRIPTWQSEPGFSMIASHPAATTDTPTAPNPTAVQPTIPARSTSKSHR